MKKKVNGAFIHEIDSPQMQYIFEHAKQMLEEDEIELYKGITKNAEKLINKARTILSEKDDFGNKLLEEFCSDMVIVSRYTELSSETQNNSLTSGSILAKIAAMFWYSSDGDNKKSVVSIEDLSTSASVEVSGVAGVEMQSMDLHYEPTP